MDEGLICRRVSQKDSRLHRGSHRFAGMPGGLFHHSVLISVVFFVCLFLDLAFDLHKLCLLRNTILVPLFSFSSFSRTDTNRGGLSVESRLFISLV